MKKKVLLFLLLIISLFTFNTTVNAEGSIPTSYNLADHYNIRTENQGEEGNCWTFAALETLETYLQIHGYGTFDFSENHLNYIESDLFKDSVSNRKINTGGSYSEFKDYVNKKFGPVLEKDFPYGESYNVDNFDSLLNVTPFAYVSEYIQFPSINKESNSYTEEELTDFRNKVKEHIMTNGAVETSIIAPTYYENEFYNPITHAAYFPTKESRFVDHGHSVAIIGWDDNYSKDNFAETNKPEHDGAYIILNSWGLTFGDEGLYYISYDDVYVEQNLNGILKASINKDELNNTVTTTIQDENLYNALKEVLGRIVYTYNDETKEISILKDQINQILDLDLSNKGISDLTGMDIFTNLYTINLSHNNLSSLSGLSSSVTGYDLSYNNFSIVPSELTGKDLDKLFIGNNPITDYSNLSTIPKIITLSLENGNVTSSDLAYIKNIEVSYLNLSSNNISDYSEIKNNSYMSLDVSYNNNIDYNTLPTIQFEFKVSHTSVDESLFDNMNLSNILSLDISYTNIKDMSKLPTSINSLNISGNKNIINLNSINGLRMLVYRDAGLDSVLPFVNMNVSQLNLSDNNISDYYDLLNNQSLQFLDLNNNNITEFYNSNRVIITMNNNKFKPYPYYSDKINTMYNQQYEEIVNVDTSRDNRLSFIENYLTSLNNNSINYSLENASFNDGVLTINNLDLDMVIHFINGKYDGSIVTYHFNKVSSSDLLYISINKSPNKTLYKVGEDFDPTGLEILGYYNNNTSSILTGYEIVNGNNLQLGNNSVTIMYNDFDCYQGINVVSDTDVTTISFDDEIIYNAYVKTVKDIEKYRKENSEYFPNTILMISNDDKNKTVTMLTSELASMGSIKIISDEITKLNDMDKLLNTFYIELNGKNIEDISVIDNLAKNQRDNNKTEIFKLDIVDNKKLESLSNNYLTNVVITNSNITDVNGLTKLDTLSYEGNKILHFKEIINNLNSITMKTTLDIDSLDKKDNKIVLPEELKILQDKGLIVNAYIADRTKDEAFIRSLNKTSIPVSVENNNLVLDLNSIKVYIESGYSQYLYVEVKDPSGVFNTFKYDLRINYNKNNILDHLELANDSPITLENGVVPDLRNLSIYKVYMDNSKELITNYSYNKVPVSKSDTSITISYTENNITKELVIPIKVVDIIYEIIEGADQVYKDGNLFVKSNGNISKFVKLLVNDVELDSNYYTVTVGSTLVSLKDSYLKTLKPGVYKLTFVYTDGEVSTTFIINETSPNTGDNITLYINMFIFSSILLFISLFIKKSNNS
ncbi:MAG: hypothetical protein IKF36_00840 [Bacilli bacterium]|nr:hypothetical protein [Bacilli bacterium]